MEREPLDPLSASPGHNHISPETGEFEFAKAHGAVKPAKISAFETECCQLLYGRN